MSLKLVKSTAALALAAASLGAYASTYNGECTDKPKSEWKSTTEIKAHFAAQGYSVGKIKASGSCYELYAKDKDGKRVELFVSPADASVVGQAGTK